MQAVFPKVFPITQVRQLCNIFLGTEEFKIDDWANHYVEVAFSLGAAVNHCKRLSDKVKPSEVVAASDLSDEELAQELLAVFGTDEAEQKILRGALETVFTPAILAQLIELSMRCLRKVHGELTELCRETPDPEEPEAEEADQAQE